VRHTISLMVLLAIFWLINSGSSHFKPLLLMLGLFSVILVLLISHRMDLVDHESQPLHLKYRALPGYYLWLFKEIIISNIDVVRCIWSLKPAISPTIITLKASQKTNLAKVIYANSITLTPGTITINIEADVLTVHSLTKKAADSLLSAEMDQRVCQLES